MANELTINTLLGNKGDPVEYIIAAGSVIPKGSVMNINTSPQTATIASADELIAGITTSESKATDTFTHMSLITNCIATVAATAATGSMVLGEPVKLTGTNTVAPADDDTVEQKGEVLGRALEDVAAGASGEVLINLGG